MNQEKKNWISLDEWYMGLVKKGVITTEYYNWFKSSLEKVDKDVMLRKFDPSLFSKRRFTPEELKEYYNDFSAQPKFAEFERKFGKKHPELEAVDKALTEGKLFTEALYEIIFQNNEI